mgnify:CR=1 FL=1
MRSLFKLAAIAALSLFALPQGAAAQGYEPGRVVQAVEYSDLQAIVLALGHTIEQQAPSGPRSIRAVTPGGLTYFMIGTACDQNRVRGCQGLIMQVRFEVAETATLDSLSRANNNFSPLNVWAMPERGMMGMTRYVVLNGGVTMANLRENMNVLLGLTGPALDVVTGAQ